jgi:hypothetical protein
VVRAVPARGQPGRLIWAQLLADVGAAQAAARLLEGGAGPLQLDRAARQLAAGSRRLLVVDDLDHGGSEAVEFLAVLAGRLAAGSSAVEATAGAPLGLGRELRLGGLTEQELAAVVGPVPADARHALWVASRGLPGVARSLAATLAGPGAEGDPLTHLALHAPSSAEFLDLDVDLVRLLEAAAGRAGARVLARLAYELLADASAGPRRRQLADQALRLARRVGGPTDRGRGARPAPARAVGPGRCRRPAGHRVRDHRTRSDDGGRCPGASRPVLAVRGADGARPGR